MKLPIEAALLVLSFLGRQTLGRVLVANRRLNGIVNRHRKTLNLPEIPVPPRLSTLLKCLGLLAIATHLLLPIGIVYARRSTRSQLRAAGVMPASYRDVRQFLGVHHQPFACSTTCDSQQQWHAECDFKYTVEDASKGTITMRNCTTTGLPFTNASLATNVGWKCSFDYAVKEYTVDSGESFWRTVEFHWVLWTNLLFAVLASADAVKLLRMDRMIADKYMAATSGWRRDAILEKHDELRFAVVYMSVTGFIFAGLYGSLASERLFNRFGALMLCSCLFWRCHRLLISNSLL